ncbi:MAG: SseB family protein [Loktanella sp.]|nr:SseB family protein [Loktanella sp.]
MTETALDRAHAAMDDAPEDDAKRLAFYEAFADSELFLLLSGEAEGEQVTPALFTLEGGDYALVFDSEDRLAEFTKRPAPYAGVPGRGLAQMLTGQGIGLALNLEVAPSAMLIPSEAVDWLVATLAHAPEETSGRLTSLNAPTGIPVNVRDALARKLSLAAGLAQRAYLAAATYDSGTQGHVLVFVDAVDRAERGLVTAASEALTFSGIEAGTIDVLFCAGTDPLAERLERVALRFDLPQPQERPARAAPGSDPDKPPRLR